MDLSLELRSRIHFFREFSRKSRIARKVAIYYMVFSTDSCSSWKNTSRVSVSWRFRSIVFCKSQSKLCRRRVLSRSHTLSRLPLPTISHWRARYLSPGSSPAPTSRENSVVRLLDNGNSFSNENSELTHQLMSLSTKFLAHRKPKFQLCSFDILNRTFPDNPRRLAKR